MRLTIQKGLAAKILKCGKYRVAITPERVADVKEAVTAEDIRSLIAAGIIRKKQIQGISRVRARRRIVQKRKGLRTGHGSRKGKAAARQGDKDVWVLRIRAQRSLLKRLKDKKMITTGTFQDAYRKAKGGFFRSQHHIKLYLEERDLFITSKDTTASKSAKTAKK